MKTITRAHLELANGLAGGRPGGQAWIEGGREGGG